jgi:hypothetical protein
VVAQQFYALEKVLKSHPWVFMRSYEVTIPPLHTHTQQALEAKKDNAAAGLKTVTKDMQTWREDYKKPTDAPPLPKPKVG